MIKIFKFVFCLSRKVSLFGLLIMASYQSVQADCTSFGEGNFDFPRFAVKIEYLYFQPTLDNDFIAAPNIDGQIPFSLQPGGPGKRNQFDYASGYRLSAFYSNSKSCSFIKNGGFRFTHLPAKHTKKGSLDSLFSSINSSSEVDMNQSNSSQFFTSIHQLNYYAGDLFYNHNVFDNCSLNLAVQPSLHFAHMTFQSLLQFSTINSLTLKEKSDTGGLGPKLGFALNYHFYDWITLNGGIKGALLISRARTCFRVKPYTEGENFDNASDIDNHETLWKVFPCWETNVGLCLSFLVQGYPVDLELGYEYLTYPNFINRIQFLGNDSFTEEEVIFTNFDFHGPYASLSIAF